MKDLLVNNLEIAKKQDQLKGEIDISSLARLSEMTVSESHNSQKIYYQLTGTKTKFHLPSLHLAINTVLPVTCQRCLETMQLELSLDYDYLLSATEPDVFEGDVEVDWLETSQAMNLHALIEDELLIAIPFAPVHKTSCQPITYEAGEKQNPFDVLKKLKNKS